MSFRFSKGRSRVSAQATACPYRAPRVATVHIRDGAGRLQAVDAAPVPLTRVPPHGHCGDRSVSLKNVRTMASERNG